MKFKMIAFILALTMVSWAQTVTPNASTQSTQSDAKASCPCCQKMADSKDMKSCCAHHEAGKAGESTCCSGKDAKACMKGDKDKTAACQHGKCCGAQDSNKDCCAKCGTETTAMACCGGQCGMDHHDHTTASN